MSVDSNVRSNPTGEVRPESHKLTPNQVRRRLALPRERCGAPSVAFERQCGLPHASNEGSLDMELALSGECRGECRRHERLISLSNV
jgi:hypothetical protein